MRELNAALCDVEPDDAVRAVIITGAGDRIFCAGADLGSAFSGGDVATFIRFGNSVLRRIERFPKPVVAAINGHALGGGCEIAMACHIRILKETARMGQTESNLGIIPGYGGTQRLPRLIGRANGARVPDPRHADPRRRVPPHRPRQPAQSRRARRWTTPRRWPASSPSAPPVATRLIIEAVDDGLEAPIDQALEIEMRAFLQALRTEDAGEGIQAFFAKRPAEFKGR